jgi:choline dehydrogenase-like flavoprotein
LKSVAKTSYHAVGSCSMLPREKGGVVDPELRVYGTSNVRVVDLGIVPLHFTGHSQATVYAIAEQGKVFLFMFVCYDIGLEQRRT